MEILSRFERRAIEDIQTDNKIDVDNYIGMAFRKDWPKSNYSIDDILKPGKLWD
jgi:hypothetical protein